MRRWCLSEPELSSLEATYAMKQKRKLSPAPPEWGDAEIRRIIDYYDNQKDEDIMREIEMLPPSADEGVWVQIPELLLPQVSRLISEYKNRGHTP